MDKAFVLTALSQASLPSRNGSSSNCCTLAIQHLQQPLTGRSSHGDRKPGQSERRTHYPDPYCGLQIKTECLQLSALSLVYSHILIATLIGSCCPGFQTLLFSSPIRRCRTLNLGSFACKTQSFLMSYGPLFLDAKGEDEVSSCTKPSFYSQ